MRFVWMDDNLGAYVLNAASGARCVFIHTRSRIAELEACGER